MLGWPGRPAGVEAQALRLLCRRCGRQLPVDDAALLECVVGVAQREGISVGAGTITIELTCKGCSTRPAAAKRVRANYMEDVREELPA